MPSRLEERRQFQREGAKKAGKARWGLALRLAAERRIPADAGGELAEPDQHRDGDHGGDDRVGVEAGEAHAEAKVGERRLDRLIPRQRRDQPG